MNKALISIFTFLILFGTVKAQDVQLEKLLEKAEKSTQTYVELFRDLTALENKTIEIYKKEGPLRETRKIKSYFIVYQSQKDNLLTEFRSVLEFNGRSVSRTDENVVKFFEKLAKSDNAAEEFQRIKQESIRYDGPAIVWGVTLNKGFFLQSDVRKIFNYQITGKEKIEDRDVYVVEFRQREYSHFVLANPTVGELKRGPGAQFDIPLSNDFKPTNPRLNGKFWLDAETGEMWKSEYEVFINPASVAEPLLINKSSYIYQPSKFNITVPKTISITTYQVLGKPGQTVTTAKATNTTLEYKEFNSLNSEITDYKIDKKKP